jgi:hypothetical protein
MERASAAVRESVSAEITLSFKFLGFKHPAALAVELF